MKLIRKLIGDKRGVGTIEYALVASLISIAALASYQSLGGKVQGKFTSIDQNLGNHL
jgi:Flp pilus assembly pilin Flp